MVLDNDADLRRLREEVKRQREINQRLEEENRRRMVRLAEQNTNRRQNGR